ncbi:phosphoglycerate mutase [uncultured Thiohalocapsa sp.]|uniref:phosphoglycerate mutase n=1 Tax=uncultured Thiohalocapsa sp. TaxID=768990 RepID=UPI0025F1802C|nr:phosphoglycerate mutase [uncultured Thiohalocapsa sp.]
MPATLDLIVPGLLGPVPPTPDPLETPTLDLLLDQADETPDAAAADLASVLLARFGAEASAPYALAADDPDWDRQGWWLHADPVHLRPDRDLLRLFDARHLGISQAEADGLVAELNAHFADDGLRVHAPAADRWYLRCGTPPAMSTTPLAQVTGQHIDPYLPTGADASRWGALMSEAQMLLFQSPVNQAREAAGRPAVNGLWCWGGGRWRVPSTPPDLAVGSTPLLRGLAAAGDAAHRPQPGADVGTLLSGADGRLLVVWDALEEALADRDVAAWAGAVERLEQWLAPLPAALRRGACGELRLHACDGHERVVRGDDLGWRLRAPRWLPGARRRTLMALAAPPGPERL